MPRPTKASIGAISAGTSTFSTMLLLTLIAPVPAATRVAPTIPPISACDELEGSPSTT